MSELRFDGRVAVVTGAGAGLGREYALLLASRGAKVVVNDLGGDPRGGGKSTRAADVVVQEIRKAGGTAVPDYNSVVEGQKVIKTALDNFGRIDILINNAGILRDKSFLRIPKEDWDAVHDVHLKGSFLLTQAAFEIFKKQGYGRIIMTTSNAGLYGNFGQANYSAAKMGLVGLASTVAIEGNKNNIYCNVIAPLAASRLTRGIVSDELFEHLKPEYIAPIVVYLCHESSKENGIIIDSTAGWAAKTHLVRGKGVMLRKNITDNVTLEKVRDNWKSIVDMSDAVRLNSLQEVTLDVTNELEKLKTGGAGASSMPTQYEFSNNDFILYALGVGASVQRPGDLRYLYEGHKSFSPIPSFFIQPSLNALFQTNMAEDAIPGRRVTLDKILHGEQYLEVVRNPQPGKLNSVVKIAEILDKGAAGVIVLEVESYNSQKELMVRNQIVVFASGCGNFGGQRAGTKTVPSIPKPKRNPDASASYSTSVDQAALFRLSGDPNPLHIDPDMAKIAGFDKPILHGLCSLGISVRIIIAAFANYNSSLFKSVKARFARPVLPGQMLRVDMWQEGPRIHFESVIVETNTVAIAGAYVDLKSVNRNTAKL